ncbi:MAG: acyl-CoA dehydrogenase [Rhodospirillaceae bacterium]|nr:acyl-CoA dehydrogenase [Rhodospirillaceae bacterium]
MALDPETFNQLLETVDRYVKERLVPHEKEVSEKNQIPPELVLEMKELGLFGISIPEKFGGMGLTNEEEVRLIMTFSQTSPAFRILWGGNVGIGSQGIVLDGTDAQKQHYLPKLASGEYISSFALTETEAGSDAASVKTIAEREDGSYVLNGRKRFITNAQNADIITVMARTGDDISAFIVEKGVPGLSFGKPEKKMGLEGTHICDVVFEDYRVPAENLIGGQEGLGFKTAMKVLDRGRMSVAAGCVGVAERLIEECVAYSLERQQFGKPIAEFQLIQAMLADSQTEAYAAKTMVLDAARKKDAGEDIIMEAACCKMFASEMVGRVADRAVQIFGGAGYVADYPIERFYRDVRVYRIYEGTTQIQQLIIARQMLKDKN